MIAIAIDGPSGAGKSTLARHLARQFAYIYVDTGALYRAVALAVIQAKKDPTNAADVQGLLPHIKVALSYHNGEQRVILNGDDVSQAIRDEAVSMAASGVSAHVATRDFLLETQRRMAKENNVVMDGRDIGTVVLPTADLKIFLTASVDDRARRRFEQLLQGGHEADYETVKQDVVLRDHNDTSRAASPLKKAQDAVEVDTTGQTLEESLQILSDLVQATVAGKGKAK